MKKTLLLSTLFLSGVIFLSACIYDAPVTAKPTRDVEGKLVGDWMEKDSTNVMKIRKFNEKFYVVEYDGLYRAHHSDFAGLPIITLQDLDSPDHKFAFVDWKLSPDGQNLTVRTINRKIVTEENKQTSALQKAIKANRTNPELFNSEAGFFTRKKVESKSLWK